MTDAAPPAIVECEYCRTGSPIYTAQVCCKARALADAPAPLQSAIAEGYRAALPSLVAETVLEHARQRIRAARAARADDPPPDA